MQEWRLVGFQRNFEWWWALVCITDLCFGCLNKCQQKPFRQRKQPLTFQTLVDNSFLGGALN